MFARIGITDGRYQEFESAEDPAEALATWALLNSAGDADGAARSTDVPEDPAPRPTSFHERVAELRRRPADAGAAPTAPVPEMPVSETPTAGERPPARAAARAAPTPVGSAPRNEAGTAPRKDESTVVQTRRIVPRRPPPAGAPTATEGAGARPPTVSGQRPPTIMPHRTPTVVPRRPLRTGPAAEPTPARNGTDADATGAGEAERTVAAPRQRPVERPAPAAGPLPPERRTVAPSRHAAAEAAEDRTLVRMPRPAAAVHDTAPEDRTTIGVRRWPASPRPAPEAVASKPPPEAVPPEDRTLVRPRRPAAAAQATPPEERATVQRRPVASSRPAAPSRPAPEPAAEERTLFHPPRAAAEARKVPPVEQRPAGTLRRELRAGLGMPPATRRDEGAPEPRPARAREDAPAPKTPLQRVFARLGHDPAPPEGDGHRRRGQTPLSQIFRRLS